MDSRKMVSINGDYESPSSTYLRLHGMSNSQLVDELSTLGDSGSSLDDKEVLIHRIMSKLHGKDYTY